MTVDWNAAISESLKTGETVLRIEDSDLRTAPMLDCYETIKALTSNECMSNGKVLPAGTKVYEYWGHVGDKRWRVYLVDSFDLKLATFESIADCTLCMKMPKKTVDQREDSRNVLKTGLYQCKHCKVQIEVACRGTDNPDDLYCQSCWYREEWTRASRENDLLTSSHEQAQYELRLAKAEIEKLRIKLRDQIAMSVYSGLLKPGVAPESAARHALSAADAMLKARTSDDSHLANSATGQDAEQRGIFASSETEPK